MTKIKIKKVMNMSSTHTVDNMIKSVRVYEKDTKIHLDYRLQPELRRDGKDRYRFSTGEIATKRALMRIEREKFSLALAHYLENHKIRSGEVYFKDIADEALEEGRNERREDVHQDYRNILKNHILPHFGEMLLEDIKPADLKKWKNTMIEARTLSQSRYKKYHRVLNFVMHYAYMNEYIYKNPMDLVDKKSKKFKPKATNSNQKYYSLNEVKLIIENAEGWFKAYMITLFYTGMRSGESIALQWSDIDFESETIKLQRSIRHGRIRHTTKTGVTNIIDMASPVKEALQNLYEERLSDQWVFPNPNTLEPFIEPKRISKKYFEPLLKELDIEYKTLYATRHTFASIMVEKNLPLTYVQKQLGHKKLSTTMQFYIQNGLMNNGARDSRLDTLFS